MPATTTRRKPRIPAGIDRATAAFGSRGQFYSGTTLDGRFSIFHGDSGSTTWAVKRHSDGEILAFEPSAKVALANIASGYTDREMDRAKAEWEARQAARKAAGAHA
jgi:hypothetical protein